MFFVFLLIIEDDKKFLKQSILLKERKPIDGYPLDVSRWRGIPRIIDSVFTSNSDG
jgi:hypothetical protein